MKNEVQVLEKMGNLVVVKTNDGRAILSREGADVSVQKNRIAEVVGGDYVATHGSMKLWLAKIVKRENARLEKMAVIMQELVDEKSNREKILEDIAEAIAAPKSSVSSV